MDEADVRGWFDSYLDAFAACGRGAAEIAGLLAYYDVPLLLTTDAETVWLTSAADVLAAMQQQIETARSAAYHHSEILRSQVTVLNATSALYDGSFVRRRADLSEISRLEVTYVVTDRAGNRRISAMLVHRHL